MLIKALLCIIFVITIVLGVINGLWLHKKGEEELISIFTAILKIVLPIFALIALFTTLDYNSFWFIVYLSIYYIFESIYNLLIKISLKDINGNRFYPNLLELKTKKIINIFTIIYTLSFHLLMHNTITNWIINSLAINIISVFGLVVFSLLAFVGLILVLYDFFTIIEFSIFNNLINKLPKKINFLTYKQLYKKINYLDKFFIPVFTPEIDTKIKLKIIVFNLKDKFSE